MTLPLPLTKDIATPQAAPAVSLAHLDDLWFQVGGTLCNLECTHCFISCSPRNHAFGFLDLAMVHRVLEESVPLGVKEYYFTGGEPFLNSDMVAILELTLRYGPATVLTNGTLFKEEGLAALRRAEDASLYSLEFRVSIDGFTAETNDAIRGTGSLARAMRGVRQLLAYDFMPIITVTRTEDETGEASLVEGFVRVLREHG
jgi:MoaA/NifB/PqqE/SkfB family radical SAM enzyme